MKPLEQLALSHKYTALPDHFYTRQPITPLRNLRLASFNSSVAELLGLDPKEAERSDFPEFFNGDKSLPGAEPIATVYAGHQFGQYVPQLGDGRALLLGEVSHDNRPWEVQLKGAGHTPYSRMGDGRAVVRSTVREYLCGEAMHGLGIPTTRALCMLVSDTPVVREKLEKGALLVRTAPSHLRFGNFEVFYYRDQVDSLRSLLDYVIEHYYPELGEAENSAFALLKEVTRRTAELIAQWQAVGFAHGVMNTDNMSILGLTIDYGPFGFLDTYDPGFICNHSDHTGRYAFDQQPDIGLWNCAALAQALLPFITMDEAKEVMGEYKKHYALSYTARMHEKLGFSQRDSQSVALIEKLLQLLKKNHVDYTRFFRALGDFDSLRPSNEQSLRDIVLDREAFDVWAEEYRQRLQSENSDDAQRREAMRRTNPKFILRNYLAQQAIEKAEQGDFTEVDTLLHLLQAPFDEHDGFDAYANEPPEWAQEISVSCSS